MDYILRMLMGPWTTYIVYNLRTYGPQRFGELKRRVAGISAKMLTERLRTLEGAGLIKRDYEATIPPKVTYSLTPRGHELDEVLESWVRWRSAGRRRTRAASEPERGAEGGLILLIAGTAPLCARCVHQRGDPTESPRKISPAR